MPNLIHRTHGSGGLLVLTHRLRDAVHAEQLVRRVGIACPAGCPISVEPAGESKEFVSDTMSDEFAGVAAGKGARDVEEATVRDPQMIASLSLPLWRCRRFAVCPRLSASSEMAI